MLLAVQQLLLGKMRKSVASRGIPIGVFAINRAAVCRACCQIVGLLANDSVAHRAHAAERTPRHHVLPICHREKDHRHGVVGAAPRSDSP
jgi:hypothetical protein